MRPVSRSFLAASILLSSFLALFASTGTRNDGSRPVKLSESTEVLGTTVPPGSYDLRWTREAGSETVKLQVTHGKKVFASGKGVWASSDQPYPVEALVYRHAGTASNALAEIRFRGSADWIRVDSTTGDAPTSGGTR
jgi:hypothetical protein